MGIFYHGTTQENADNIADEGFLGSELDDCTVGRHITDGVVFLAQDKSLAEDYGDAIIEVHTDNAKPFGECPATGKDEFYVTVEALVNDGAWWQI